MHSWGDVGLMGVRTPSLSGTGVSKAGEAEITEVIPVHCSPMLTVWGNWSQITGMLMCFTQEIGKSFPLNRLRTRSEPMRKCPGIPFPCSGFRLLRGLADDRPINRVKPLVAQLQSESLGTLLLSVATMVTAGANTSEAWSSGAACLEHHRGWFAFR